LNNLDILSFHSALLSVGHRWVALQHIILRRADDCQLAFVIPPIGISNCAGAGLTLQDNGMQGTIERKPRCAVVFERISRIYNILNPDKLTGIALRDPAV
jgi:hypothetical protein